MDNWSVIKQASTYSLCLEALYKSFVVLAIAYLSVGLTKEADNIPINAQHTPAD